MSERIIDPTRQGIPSPEPEPTIPDRQYSPISTAAAIEAVDSWAEGWGPFRLHQIARALRAAISDLETKRQQDAERMRKLSRRVIVLQGELDDRGDVRDAAKREIATQAVLNRVLATVPCPANDPNCACPGHPYAACCRMRMALKPDHETSPKEPSDA